jgi:holo-[acyl-carrier protein] synthase
MGQDATLLRSATRPPAASATVRVGLDVASIAQVAASIDRFGDRYLRRVFTDHELESCGRRADGLAARFAAKEATIKVLQPNGAQPDWRSMEIVRGASGACALHLTDTAAGMASDAGIRSLAVSLTHEADVAAAVVVALIDESEVVE